MFGGRIQPINGRVDGTHGLSVSDWPGDEDLDTHSDRRIFYSIPMGYIEGLFQTQNWEQKHNLKNWKQYHIPRTGALSIDLNCFTTMPWEEEVHEITSTIAEDLSLSEPDEPVRKRRETRTGSSVIATKGYGEEERPSHPLSRTTKPAPPDQPEIKSPTHISAAAVHRNPQAMKSQQDKLRARARERAIEAIRSAGRSSRKTNLMKEAIKNYNTMPVRSHDFNYGQSIPQKPGGENLGEETMTTGNQNYQWPQSQSQSSRTERLSHLRIRGLKAAANANPFRPTGINYPHPRFRGGVINSNDE